MSSPKLKIFPKLKKQLIQFLSDESGKVQKGGVLAVGIGGAMLVGGLLTTSHPSSVSAATEAECTINYTYPAGGDWESWYYPAGHSNWPAPGLACTHNNSYPHSSGVYPEYISVGHLSGYAPVNVSDNINGHYNSIPTSGWAVGRWHVNVQAAYHSSSSSHSNTYDFIPPPPPSY